MLVLPCLAQFSYAAWHPEPDSFFFLAEMTSAQGHNGSGSGFVWFLIHMGNRNGRRAKCNSALSVLTSRLLAVDNTNASTCCMSTLAASFYHCQPREGPLFSRFLSVLDVILPKPSYCLGFSGRPEQISIPGGFTVSFGPWKETIDLASLQNISEEANKSCDIMILWRHHRKSILDNPRSRNVVRSFARMVYCHLDPCAY